MLDVDEDRLFRMVGPLPLTKLSEVVSQLEQAGGMWILHSVATQEVIGGWSRAHQAAQVLHELSKAVQEGHLPIESFKSCW